MTSRNSRVRFLLALPCVLWWMVGCQRQDRRGDVLAADALRSDNALLGRVLREVHPGTLRYRTAAEVDAAIRAMDDACAAGLDRDGYFVALARATAFIRCGHTFPSPHNLPKALAEEMFGRADRIPLHFRWIDGRMIVMEGFGDARSVARGSEVLSVDGVPAGDILGALMPLVAADGGNDGKRVELLEVAGLERHCAFDMLYPRVFRRQRLQAPKGTYRLEVLAPGGGSRTVIEAAPIAQRERDAAAFALADAQRDESTPLWALSYGQAADGEWATLRMPTWVTYNSKWDWRAFLDGAFDELIAKGTPDLVIDLRGNGGGSSIGDAILARLVERPVRIPTFRRMVRYREAPRDLDRQLDTWDDSFRHWGDAAGEPTMTVAGTLRPLVREGERADGIDVIEPRGARYAGRVWVITCATNSSATFEFAMAVRTLRCATLVGQTTGGNQRGINGGAFFFLRLPASGLEVDIPIIAFVPPDGSGQRPDAGIEPDIAVRPSAADVTDGVDAEMRAIREAIAAMGSAPARRRER